MRIPWKKERRVLYCGIVCKSERQQPFVCIFRIVGERNSRWNVFLAGELSLSDLCTSFSPSYYDGPHRLQRYYFINDIYIYTYIFTENSYRRLNYESQEFSLDILKNVSIYALVLKMDRGGKFILRKYINTKSSKNLYCWGSFRQRNSENTRF